MNENLSQEKHWCMCSSIKSVYRDCFSTCSICGGMDAYGTSKNRPRDKNKDIPIKSTYDEKNRT